VRPLASSSGATSLAVLQQLVMSDPIGSPDCGLVVEPRPPAAPVDSSTYERMRRSCTNSTVVVPLAELQAPRRWPAAASPRRTALPVKRSESFWSDLESEGARGARIHAHSMINKYVTYTLIAIFVH
jgi:hypothetical protein